MRVVVDWIDVRLVASYPGALLQDTNKHIQLAILSSKISYTNY